MRLPSRTNYSGANFGLFFLGLISSLFVQSPFGRVSMLDFATYILAPVVFIIDFNNYSRIVRKALVFAILWLIGGILSDWYRGTPFDVAVKANAIILNAFTLLVFAVYVLRTTPSGIIWFIAGNALSTLISFYYFQNGAILVQAQRAGYVGQGGVQSFLVDKMVYPAYAKVVLLTVIMVLRIKKLIPWWLCIFGCVVCGIVLVVKTGARSSCLVLLGAAALMYIYAYAPKLGALILKRKWRTLLCIVLAAFATSGVYMFAAKNGLLGEEGIKKYIERQEGASFMDDRADSLINWPFLWRNPVFGAGAEFIDRWGYVDRSPFVQHYLNNDPRWQKKKKKLFGHSCIVGAWTQCGLLGLFFWLFALHLIYRLTLKLNHLGDAGPFLGFVIINMIWAICFSPYGMFRGLVMFIIAFAALMETPQFSIWVARTCTKQQIFPVRNPNIMNSLG